MKYIIVNPNAGRGYCRQITPKIKEYFKQQNQQHMIVTTQYPGHATTLAVEGVKQGASEIISVGGDGTLLEVIQDIYNENVKIGVIPAGTGNDFARNIGFSLEIDEFLVQFNNAQAKPIDLCIGRDSVFFTVCGIGFATDVLNHVNSNRNSRLKGSLAFANGVFQTIKQLQADDMEICIDGEIINRRAVLAVVVNGTYVGGGMQFVPHSQVDDGLLDVFVVKEIGKLELLTVFPKVYKGKHVDHPAVEFFRGKEVTINSQRQMAKSYDGTVIGQSPVEVKLAKHKILALAPPNLSLK